MLSFVCVLLPSGAWLTVTLSGWYLSHDREELPSGELANAQIDKLGEQWGKKKKKERKNVSFRQYHLTADRGVLKNNKKKNESDNLQNTFCHCL